jgi:hypothetical protein
MGSTSLDSCGYTAADMCRLRQMAGGALPAAPEDLRRVVDNCEYADDWRVRYRVQSVRSSLRSARISCIDGAILAYGLLDLLFPTTRRSLLAIHRRNPKTDEECGHCVAMYWGADGRIGALSKSNLLGLGHRDPVFAAEHRLATSYAEAYLDMGFEPLYYGVTTLEEAASDLDWRFSGSALNEIAERLQARYAYRFDLAAPRSP